MIVFSIWMSIDPDNQFYKKWIDAAKEGSDKTIIYEYDGIHVTELAHWPEEKRINDPR